MSFGVKVAASHRSLRAGVSADHDETSWIAQKSLAKCAPLMGELSELTLDPVRYW